MPASTDDKCLTCYGAGEIVAENGPEVCPDCFGDGRALSGGAKLEWRLRNMERAYGTSGGETSADVLWLVHEVRRSREALLRILARCQDAEDADPVARDVKYQANEALCFYQPE